MKEEARPGMPSGSSAIGVIVSLFVYANDVITSDESESENVFALLLDDSAINVRSRQQSGHCYVYGTNSIICVK